MANPGQRLGLAVAQVVVEGGALRPWGGRYPRVALGAARLHGPGRGRVPLVKVVVEEEVGHLVAAPGVLVLKLARVRYLLSHRTVGSLLHYAGQQVALEG